MHHILDVEMDVTYSPLSIEEETGAAGTSSARINEESTDSHEVTNGKLVLDIINSRNNS